MKLRFPSWVRITVLDFVHCDYAVHLLTLGKHCLDRTNDAFKCAILHDDLEAVQFQLKSRLGSINKRIDGEHPLVLAMESGHEDMAIHLIEAGADISLPPNTPLRNQRNGATTITTWRREHNVSAPGPRPLEYQGPSWSWASVDCYISYFKVHRRWDDLDTRIELVDYQSSLQTGDAPYGEVQWAHITVRARMGPAFWMRESQKLTSWGMEVLMKCGVKGPEEMIGAIMVSDALEEECNRIKPVEYLPVYLLEVARRRGLVLRYQGNGLHSRLGYLTRMKGKISSNSAKSKSSLLDSVRLDRSHG